MRGELDQVAKTVQRGIDAFRALGQQAPAELQKVAAAVQKQQQALKSAGPTGGLFGNLQGAIGGLGLGGLPVSGVAAGAAFVTAAKQALAFADSLTKLSDRTGIGVVALQRLQNIAANSGNSIEDIGGAINKLQNNLIENSENTQRALSQIGLSVKDLRGLSPEQQFIAIAKGIQTIKDPALQTALAIDIFGKSGAEILPSLKADVDKLANASTQMSAEAVKALDAFGDGLTNLKNSGVSVAGTILAAFLRMAQGIKDAIPKPAPGGLFSSDPRLFHVERQEGQRPPLSVRDFTSFGPLGLRDVPQAIVTGQSAQNTAAIAAATAALRAQQAAADALGLSMEEYQQKLTDVNAKIVAAQRDTGNLTEKQRLSAVAYRELGLSAGEMSIKMVLSELAIKSFFDQLDAGFEQIKKNREETAKFQAEVGKLAVGFDRAGKMGVGFGGVMKAALVGILPPLASVQTAFHKTNLELLFMSQFGTRTQETLLRLGNVMQQLPGQTSPATEFMRGQETQTERARLILGEIREEQFKGTHSTEEWRKALDDAAQSLTQLAQVSGGAFGGIIQDIARIVVSWNQAVKAMQQYNAATTAAGKAAAALSVVGAAVGAFSGPGAGSKKAGAASGAATGFALGLATVPQFSFITAGIGAVIGAIKAMRQQAKEAKEAFSDLLKSAGGALDRLAQSGKVSVNEIERALKIARSDPNHPDRLDPNQSEATKAALADLETLKRRAAEAGLSLDALFSAHGNKELTQAIKNLTDAFSLQDDALRLFDDTVQKYNFTLGELGPAATRKLSQAALQLFQDFQVLTAGGIDAEAVLKKMGTSIQKLVQDSLKFGVALPSFLKPMLQQMIDLGRLTDAAGNKITDLSQLTFADTLATGIQSLVDTLNRLVEAIARAFKIKLPDPKPKNRGTGGGDEGNELPLFARGGIVRPWGVQHFAQGGRVLPFLPRGTDSVLAALTPGEWVLNKDQQRSAAAAMGGMTIAPVFNFNGPVVGNAGREIARIATAEIVRRIKENKGGENTTLRGALGLAS